MFMDLRNFRQPHFTGSAMEKDQSKQPETLPNVLYKYICWTDKPRDKKKNILKKNILHFSNPIDFNDPFDSMLPVVFDEKYRNSQQFYRDFLENDNFLGKSNYSLQEIEAISMDRFLNPDKVIYDTAVMTETIRKSTIEKVRISCFTTTKDNMLMWSHYADHHKGICIGFRTNLMQDSDLVMYAKVQYAKQFPKLTQLRRSRTLFVKSTDWSYEKEYRMLNIDAHSQIRYHRQAVCEVVIGYKMAETVRDSLVAFLTKSYPNIRIADAVPNPTKFKMDIKFLRSKKN